MPRRNNPSNIEHDDFPSREKSKLFDQNFSSRVITRDRMIDWGFLENIGFPYSEHIRKVVPTSLIEPNLISYDRIVRLFYNNIVDVKGRYANTSEIEMKVGETSCRCIFKSFVGGSEIVVTPRIICRLKGQNWVSREECEKYMGTELIENARIVFKNPRLEMANTRATDLDLYERLLHLIVTNVLRPRGGNYTSITREDFWLMACIMEKKNPGLHFLIPFHMMAVGKSRSGNLPYPSLISDLLAMYNIDARMDGMKVGAKLNPKHCIGAFTLSKTKWYEDDYGVWRKRGGREERGEEEGEPSHRAAEPFTEHVRDEPAPSAEPTSPAPHVTVQMIWENLQRMQDQIDCVEGKIDRVEGKVDALLSSRDPPQ